MTVGGGGGGGGGGLLPTAPWATITPLSMPGREGLVVP